MSRLTTLIASNLPSESTAVQQKSYVTFTCLPPNAKIDEDSTEEPTLTLLERRHLISGSLTTGFRTWEAALHLGSYLLSPAGRRLIEGKSVLELGAGTGFLAILAAKCIGAKHVTTTDGDEGVVEALRENMQLNGLDDDEKVTMEVLRWGEDLKGTCVEQDLESWPYAVVIGADIVRWWPCRIQAQKLMGVDVRQSRHRRTCSYTALALRPTTRTDCHHIWCDPQPGYLRVISQCLQ